MLSWMQGPSIGLLGQTVGDMLRASTAKFPNNIAVNSRMQNTVYTYSELLQRSEEFAEGLCSLGIQKGDRVGMCAGNIAEWPVVQYGTALAGIVLVNINPAYTAEEIAFTINEAGCKALITMDLADTGHYQKLIASLAPEVSDNTPGNLKSEKMPSLESLILCGPKTPKGYFNFNDIYGRKSDNYANRTATVDYKSCYNIQFTSGTTGLPKGAMLSHFNVVNNARITAYNTELHSEDILCLPLPMFHCFAMVVGALGAHSTGASVIFPHVAYNGLATLQAMHEEKCTTIYAVPAMFADVCREQSIHNLPLPHADKGAMAGAMLPPVLVQQCIDVLNIKRMIGGYGQTETSPASFCSPLHASMEKRTTTSGKILPHTECKIMETVYDDEEGNLVVRDDAKIVPMGTHGEVWVRGYLNMLGYWNNPKKTAETVTPDGWNKSGDLGFLDEEGYVTITGRIKDMIIRGGENIYPGEIENALRLHPNILDVSIIGQPEERLGEEVRAVIILQDKTKPFTLEELKDWCEPHLAKYKIPEYIDFTDEFPLTTTRKVIKGQLKKQFNFKI